MHSTRENLSRIAGVIRQGAHPLAGTAADYDGLLEAIGEARLVLIGEASHGTHEFYLERARITQRLIQEKAFTAVAVEADWPDAYRVNCYVRGAGEDGGANESLEAFKKFPQWMWRNTDVLHFVGWLRGYNAEMPANPANVGFYGMDLYSLHASMGEVVRYLERVDPEAAQRARARYSCFDEFAQDTEAYGFATALGGAEPCEDEAVRQLVELQRRAADYASQDGPLAQDRHFYAEQNARLVVNAEEYYRSMFRGRVSSWNLRDRHMAETLEALLEHLDRTAGGNTKVVVWAHNSHLGDARATEVSKRDEWNVGQLVREKHGRNAFLIGFSTYGGTVTAASNWDEPGERKKVRPAIEGSYESLFHQVCAAGELSDFWLNLREENSATKALLEARLQRAIGVIYRPDTERQSHYFEAHLPQQFDAILHFDQTSAVEPLDTAGVEPVITKVGEVPETFPEGM